MNALKFDYSKILDFISKDEIYRCEGEAKEALNKLIYRNGEGSNYTGWLNYPDEISFIDLKNIENIKNKIKKNSDCLVVIGIGGSYLGAKAIIDALKSNGELDIEIRFIGNNISSQYLNDELMYLENVDFYVNVISKSGGTIEPAIAFHLIEELMERKYGSDYSERVIVTTSNNNSLLHDIALKKGYEELFIPTSIGGRYSVLTNVGLLPIVCAGIDIYKLIEGASAAKNECLNSDYKNNFAMLYAACRNLLYRKGKKIEILAMFEPCLRQYGEWWKQLFAESEGKENKGIFPTSTTYTTDLHSLGQYVQDGERNIFETFLDIEYPNINIYINKSNENLDKLNYLHGVSVETVKDKALEGTVMAHVSGGVPCLVITIEKLNEFNLGYLLYFNMLSCAISGYLLGVNPFNQNGVEEYKKNMRELLN